MCRNKTAFLLLALLFIIAFTVAVPFLITNYPIEYSVTKSSKIYETYAEIAGLNSGRLYPSEQVAPVGNALVQCFTNTIMIRYETDPFSQSFSFSFTFEAKEVWPNQFNIVIHETHQEIIPQYYNTIIVLGIGGVLLTGAVLSMVFAFRKEQKAKNP
jgi:hypothetical protein